MTVLTDRGERVAEDPGPAAELAPMVEVWFRILGDHVPDEDRRCRACSGVRRAEWPCPVRALAERARQWHALGPVRPRQAAAGPARRVLSADAAGARVPAARRGRLA